MKITIDTKQDSKEEIQKMITLLKHLVDHDPVYTNTDFSNPFAIPNSNETTGNTQQEPTNAFNSMFGENSTTTLDSTEELPKEETKEKKLSIFDLQEY